MRRLLAGGLAALAVLGVGLAAAAVERPAAATVVRAARAPGGAAGTTRLVRLRYGGLPRTYLLFVPARLPTGPRPLLVALHGYTSTAAGFEGLTGLDRLAAAAGVLVAFPQGWQRSWDAGTCCGLAAAHRVDDVGFLTAVLDDVRTREPVDPLRVGLIGFSNGGMMAYRFACEQAGRVAAVAVMSATLVAPACSPSRPVPVLMVHGLADPLVPFAGVARSRLDRSGFAPVQSTFRRWERLDGCAGPPVGPASDPVAARCSDGSSVRLVTSRTLGHHWPVGALDQRRYGLDATRLTWDFVVSAWSRV